MRAIPSGFDEVKLAVYEVKMPNGDFSTSKKKNLDGLHEIWRYVIRVLSLLYYFENNNENENITKNIIGR